MKKVQIYFATISLKLFGQFEIASMGNVHTENLATIFFDNIEEL